ncbi:hypothetical protein NM688_g5093 [Phlebia brevispora]|uniref:Uncharacterized protein n=1 Tax=Phlebia brevispora TaxID=194682 RepID=A0ACC1T103_9APHY|nr:hypothetical protein NM688_g5093 [Phlebia brevispora]
MVAARSMRDAECSAQSGTGNAWCLMDSPTLGRMPSISSRPTNRKNANSTASSSRLAVQAVNVAPLNIKKIRRRALVSGVHLALPPSPRPYVEASGSSASSTPHSALTFTAEWDLTQKAFVITPLEPSYPQSTTSSHFASSPVPINVDEDSLPISPSFSVPSVYSPSFLNPHPDLPSSLQQVSFERDKVSVIDLTTDDEAEYSPSSVCTPVSSIFDRELVYSHGRNLSQSTTASSIYTGELDDEKPYEEARPDSDEEREPPSPIAKDERYLARLRGENLELSEQRLWRSDAPVSCPDIEHQRQQVFPPCPRRPLPDVPRCTSDFYSIESFPQLDSPSVTGKSIRRQLSAQISKAFTTAALFKRSTTAHG